MCLACTVAEKGTSVIEEMKVDYVSRQATYNSPGNTTY